MRKDNTNRDELLALLAELDRADPLPDDRTTSEQNKRIFQMAMNKINRETGGRRSAENTVELPREQAAPRRVRHVLRTGLLAAIICCLSAVSVYAVAPELFTMIGEKIGFFQEAPAPGSTAAEQAPRGSYEATREKLEAFNTPVGQTVTDNGVTITLDSVSMDVAGLDAFFTLSSDEAIRDQLAQRGFYPAWDSLTAGASFYNTSVNGQDLLMPDGSDWYLDADGSLRLWRHYLLSELPRGEELNVTLCEDWSALGREGEWSFDFTLDGASVRTGGKTGGAVPFTLNGEEARVDYVAFGPVSGCAFMSKARAAENEYPDVYPGSFYVTDDTGRELYTSNLGKSGRWNYVLLSAPGAGAAQVTFTPVKSVLDEEEQPVSEWRTVTADELREGARLATNSLGGYTVENYAVKDGTITYELVPYGWAGRLELIPEEDGKITLAEGHSALCSETVDSLTGVVSVRHDYYAATDEELEAVTDWSYLYEETALNEEGAVTVPLQAVKD